ncbi:MAG: Phosphate transport system regulatory protein PhoU, partial [Nocardioides sp.]|nr:Phosphate transport system regulatory protein PhoU [Nocardioides sp.]
PGRRRVERRAGLVHEQHPGLDGQRAGDAQPLLLATGQATAGGVEPVLDLVPQPAPLREILRGRTSVDASCTGRVVTRSSLAIAPGSGWVKRQKCQEATETNGSTTVNAWRTAEPPFPNMSVDRPRHGPSGSCRTTVARPERVSSGGSPVHRGSRRGTPVSARSRPPRARTSKRGRPLRCGPVASSPRSRRPHAAGRAPSAGRGGCRA